MEVRKDVSKEIKELEYKVLFHEGLIEDDMIDVWREKIDRLEKIKESSLRK